MNPVARLLLRSLDKVEPERRRLWAMKLLSTMLVVWPLSHVGLVVLPPQFFEHIMVAMSAGALIIGSIDTVSTNDVRANEDEG